MKSRNFAFLFCCMFVSIACFAQEADFKQRRYRPLIQNFEKFVREAYGNKADELIFNRPARLKTVKNIYKNSVIVVETSQKVPEHYSSFSQIELVKRYNPSVTRRFFSPDTFNPLKFKFNFYSKERQFFHVEGTQYFIIIEPFKIR